MYISFIYVRMFLSDFSVEMGGVKLLLEREHLLLRPYFHQPCLHAVIVKPVAMHACMPVRVVARKA